MYCRVYDDDGGAVSKTSFAKNNPSLGRVNTLSVPPPHTVSSLKNCIIKSEDIGPRCSAIRGWGKRVCHGWQWCAHPPLWYIPRIYRKPTCSNHIWIGIENWWGSMKPQGSVIIKFWIRFCSQPGSERDPDTRAQGSTGTDQERIWRSKPNTRVWAWRSNPKTHAWSCWGHRGMEKDERDAWARGKWSPLRDA